MCCSCIRKWSGKRVRTNQSIFPKVKLFFSKTASISFNWKHFQFYFWKLHEAHRNADRYNVLRSSYNGKCWFSHHIVSHFNGNCVISYFHQMLKVKLNFSSSQKSIKISKRLKINVHSTVSLYASLWANFGTIIPNLYRLFNGKLRGINCKL